MRIITRYILREVTSHALIGGVIFTFVLFMRDLGRILELVVRDSASLADVLRIFAFLLPNFLTLMEADLLRYLTDHESQIVSRKDILEQVWRVHEDTDTRAIDNFIVRLRRYIEDDPANPQHLVTVRGIGYRFLPNP